MEADTRGKPAPGRRNLRVRSLVALTVAGTSGLIALAIYLILGCKAVVR